MGSARGQGGEPEQEGVRGARCAWRVLKAGKTRISVGTRVAPGAELERPKAGWAWEERGKIVYMLLFSR